MSKEGWVCPTCGSVWAPWFQGPCPHKTGYHDGGTIPCDHDFTPEGMTLSPICRKCGKSKYSNTGYSISTWNPDQDDWRGISD